MHRVFKGSSRSRWLLGFASSSLLSIAFAPKVLAQVFYHINRGVEVLRDTDNADLEMNTLYTVGLRYYRQGRFARALKVFQDSLTVARGFPEGGRDREVIALNRIGLVYESLGQYQQALNSFEEALAIHQSDGTRQADAGVIHNNIGFAYFRLGDNNKARVSFEEALRIHQTWDARADEGRTFGHLGALNLSQGNFAEAIEFYQRALELHQEVGDRIGEGIALDGLGRAHSKLGDFQEAEGFFEGALEILPQDETPSYRAIALSHWGEMLLASGRLPEAETALRSTIEILESLRRDLSDADKVTIFETQTATYRLLQQTLVAQNQTEAALEIAERGRARAFVELLAWRLNRDRETFTPPPPPTIEDIKQVAAEQNATLVEYSIAGEELYIWTIAPTGEVNFRQVEIASISGEFSLNYMVEEIRYIIAGRGLVPDEASEPTFSRCSPSSDEGLAECLRSFHELLIEPIADLLPTRPEDRIIFIPQGELFLVPFPALVDGAGQSLIEKHTILTSPAIQVLEFTRQLRETQTQEAPFQANIRANALNALVVGNPRMPTQLPSGESIGLSSLPGAEDEAIAIANLLGTEALIGSAATEAAVVEKLPQAEIVHLATHGLLDDFGYGIPGAIALTPNLVSPENPTGATDGFLTAGELFDLTLKAQLVVLSACNTGRGTITGDGIIGLSRSLIATGVPSSIVSLWQVPDAPTAELMKAFYLNWRQTRDKAQALRQAMLRVKEQHPHPRNWAAFTLVGESR